MSVLGSKTPVDDKKARLCWQSEHRCCRTLDCAAASNVCRSRCQCLLLSLTPHVQYSVLDNSGKLVNASNCCVARVWKTILHSTIGTAIALRTLEQQNPTVPQLLLRPQWSNSTLEQNPRICWPTGQLGYNWRTWAHIMCVCVCPQLR